MLANVDDTITEGELTTLSDVLPLALPSLRPEPGTRARMLELVAGPLRFAPFAGRVARLFAIDPNAADEALVRIVDESAWMEGPVTGFFLAPAFVGASLAGASAAFIRARAGVTFPRHRHIGDETVLVLQGIFQDSDVPPARAGQYVHKSSGSSHDFTVPEGADCICAYLTLGGIEF